jgi:tetratricopeptide (TPR) repeat protein
MEVLPDNLRMGVMMSEQEQILSLVREADLYHDHGLLKESKVKYTQVLAILGEQGSSQKPCQILTSVQEKLRKLDKDIAQIRAAPKIPDLSPELQGLIKRIFSFSRAKEVAALEGANALAKFGQYEEALAELQKILTQGTLPIVAARHILRCYLSLSLPYAAVAQFKDWVSSETLSKEELRYVREFLQEALKEIGFKEDLPSLLGEESRRPGKSEEDECLDISAVRIHLQEGHLRGESVEMDVVWQLGKLVRVVIPARRKDLSSALKIGKRIDRMQCYSPITVFTAQGIVSKKSSVDRGPNQGDYLIDITIREK